MKLFAIFLGGMIINNILLIRFIALCSFFGVSNRLKTAVGMSSAVIFVTVLAAVISWLLWHFLLVGKLEYLRTASFILVIAALVQFVEMVIRKYFLALYTAMGIYLPLITTNCAVLAVAFMCVDKQYNLIETIVFALAVSMGYALAIILFAGVREKIAIAPIPKIFQGYAIAFISASLMSLAFVAFAGMFGIH